MYKEWELWLQYNLWALSEEFKGKNKKQYASCMMTNKYW